MDNGFVNLLKVAGLHIHTMKTDVIFMLFGDPMTYTAETFRACSYRFKQMLKC